MSLSDTELQRYSRHLLIPEVGREGQERLKASSVLLVGTGALGSPAAMYLAAAGVGRIGLVDDDEVEASNLQRQVIHGESTVGKPKLESAAARLRDLNPEVELELHATRFTPDNAVEIASQYGLIVDGSDNFPTRFLTNDTGFLLKKPVVYGAIHRFEGQASVFAPHLGGPCYRCLLPEMPAPGSVPSCAEAGVLGVLPGIIGSMQAMEAIKLLLGIGEPPLGKLTLYDALGTEFRQLRIHRDPQCRLCGEHPSIENVDSAETRASTTCSIPTDSMKTITVEELREKIASGLDGLLIDVRQPEEYEAANIEQARLIPLGELPDKLGELPRDQTLYLHCKAGGRSARAVEFLSEQGFDKAVNVEGGMDAWLKMRD
ncbi:MAG: molybdopterin-synthase adenylyltransferase MoeB [Akkermansiaceae bacterium]|nr:molybdopterin-synthase adenylyltransferase MoeB [Akkermansiaceae bacterium]